MNALEFFPTKVYEDCMYDTHTYQATCVLPTFGYAERGKLHKYVILYDINETENTFPNSSSTERFTGTSTDDFFSPVSHLSEGILSILYQLCVCVGVGVCGSNEVLPRVSQD